MRLIRRQMPAKPAKPNIGFVALIMMCVLVTLSGAGQESAILHKYDSPQEYSLEYPQGWKVIDTSNVEAVKSELSARENQFNPQYLAAWRLALERVTDHLSSAVIWNASDSTVFIAVDILVVPKEIEVNPSSQRLIQKELAPNLESQGFTPLKTKTNLYAFGSTQYLSLVQEIETYDGTLNLTNISYLIQGNKRSFIISGTVNNALLNSLKPILVNLRTTLHDTRDVSVKIPAIPNWLEFGIVGLFALFVVVMYRKILHEYNPKIYSRYEKTKSLGFFGFMGLVVVVWIVFVGIIQLIKT